MSKINKICLFIAVVLVLDCFIVSAVVFYSGHEGFSSINDWVAINQEFGNARINAPNFTFSPPITMYHALKIGLNRGGWNETTLQNKMICVSLNYYAFNNTGSSTTVQLISKVTQPIKNYSDLKIGNATYRYVWVLIVNNPSMSHTWVASGDYWVDAQTGAILTVAKIY